MSEHSYPQYIEYRPGLIDQVAGMAGRLAMRFMQRTERPLSVEAGFNINALLDTYVQGFKQGMSLDSQGDAAQALAAQFLQGSQLDRPLFFPKGVQEDHETLLTIRVRMDTPIKVPVRNFVYTPGMQDWVRGRDGPKGNRTSRQAIREYAKTCAPMPPIGMVAAYVQPDGHVLYSAILDGAHRVAAAHLRGDASIAVGGDVVVS